jgi:hypothetical protein
LGKNPSILYQYSSFLVILKIVSLKMTAEAEIRAYLEECDEAHKARDIKRLMKTYSPDATLITVVRI